MIGSKQYSRDLPQGGLEIPCVLTFSSGEQREILKVQKLVEEINAYITTNSDATDKEPKNKRQRIDFLEVNPMPSATDQSSDKRHKNSTGGDSIMGSSDIDLDCIVVVVEDSNEQFTGSISEDLEWIHINSIILKKSDKELILNGKRLSDMHINAAQKILSQQFPSFSGFNSTLKYRCIGKLVSNYIQIFFCRGCHWITASTVGCKEGVINIFDSLYCDVDAEAVAGVFPDSDISFNVPSVPMQLGADA